MSCHFMAPGHVAISHRGDGRHGPPERSLLGEIYAKYVGEWLKRTAYGCVNVGGCISWSM